MPATVIACAHPFPASASLPDKTIEGPNRNLNFRDDSTGPEDRFTGMVGRGPHLKETDVVKGYISLAEARAAQADRLAAAADAIGGEVVRAREAGALAGPGPIFLGIGASFAASGAAVWTLRARGIHAMRLNAGEYPIPFPATHHPLIGVSQSGKSAETLAVFNSVDPALRISVVNAKDSPIAAISATNVSLGAIPDSYASTIGYTATVMALGMIAEAWDGGDIDPSWTSIAPAVRAVESVLAERINQLVGRLADAQYVDCAAVASSVGSAEVGSLLLREIARIPATGMSTRQYLHGAMESAGQGAHILFGDEREAELARTLARAGHETILVSPLAVPEEAHLSHIPLPAVSPAQRPILEAVVMQTIAVEAAIARGLDPDAFVFEHNDTKVA
jgi:glucosamine--fructose-6-phosphate aminotransferase (isomerizing)